MTDTYTEAEYMRKHVKLTADHQAIHHCPEEQICSVPTPPDTCAARTAPLRL